MIVKKLIDTKITAEGVMYPIFRDWDSIIPGYKPSMVYATSISPGCTKGPILHNKRTGYLTSIGGKTDIEYYEDGKLKRENLNNGTGEIYVAIIPPGIPIKFINNDTKESLVINLPDIAWHPENQDTEKFKDWGEYLDYVKK